MGDYHYAVFDYFNEDEGVKVRRGVAVSRNEGETPVAEFTCAKPATAQLHKLAKYVPVVD